MQVPYHKSEKKHAQALDEEAERIRCYSLKKFIEVKGPRGEVLLGYLAFNAMVYYYRPASMLWVSTHTTLCDYEACEIVNDLEPYPKIRYCTSSSKACPKDQDRSPSAPPYSPASPAQENF